MSNWVISTTPTFLHEILKLPRHISNKVTKRINEIQKDPQSLGGKAIQLKGNKSVYRIYVDDDHRLFYSFGNDWIKLLSVCNRKDCYKKKIPDPTIPQTLPPTVIAENIWLEEEQTEFITKNQLQEWKIPKEYWPSILQITNEDDILTLGIPENYIFKLIDNLSPRDLEEIETQKEFLLTNPEKDLNSYIEGKIEIEEFLLKLSPEQERIKNLQTDNAILVKGGPGTGKSIVAIYRVKKLVDNHIQGILFTTYTESLANYSKQLLKSLLGRSPEEYGVEVSTVDQLIIRYYERQYGAPFFPEDGGQIFLQTAIRQLSTKEQKLLNRLDIKFLIEEFKSVIEARGISTLESYMNNQSKDYSFNKRESELIWKIYENWRQILQDSGHVSKGIMQQKALELVERSGEKIYNAIIIDEVQDISPIALRFLTQIVISKSGLYLTADTSQSLYQQGFSWNYIQDIIQLTGKVETLTKSYRSTSQITKACADIFYRYPQVNHSEMLPAGIDGSKPIILLTDDPKKIVSKIKEFFRASAKSYKLPLYAGAILTPDSDLGKLTARHLNVAGLNTLFMENEEIDITRNCIKIIPINLTKGLEFPFVCIIGLDKDKLPNLTGIAEQNRDEAIIKQLRLFYVGCSRAMRSLLVCASKTSPSPFIEHIRNSSYWLVEEL